MSFSKRWSFMMRKIVFGFLKDGILQCKRWHFTFLKKVYKIILHKTLTHYKKLMCIVFVYYYR